MRASSCGPRCLLPKRGLLSVPIYSPRSFFRWDPSWWVQISEWFQDRTVSLWSVWGTNGPFSGAVSKLYFPFASLSGNSFYETEAFIWRMWGGRVYGRLRTKSLAIPLRRQVEGRTWDGIISALSCQTFRFQFFYILLKPKIMSAISSWPVFPLYK